MEPVSLIKTIYDAYELVPKKGYEPYGNHLPTMIGKNVIGNTKIDTGLTLEWRYVR